VHVIFECSLVKLSHIKILWLLLSVVDMFMMLHWTTCGLKMASVVTQE